MSYFDTDGLLRKYGTEKAIPTTGGEYRTPGSLRDEEFTVDLSTLPAGTTTIINDVTFFGTSMYIEQVELIADTAITGGTSFSIGLRALDRTTDISTTAFANGVLIATVAAAGNKVVLTKGSTGAGAYLGTTSASPGYITMTATGTFVGTLKFRIKFRGIGTITR